MKIRTQKLDYTWVIVFLCFLLGFFCLGFCSGNKGLYLTAITKALGIPRSLFSINDSIRYLTTALVALAFGNLVHRFGVRVLILVGILCLAVSTVLFAMAEQLWVFYLSGAILGVGMPLCTTAMISYIIRRWCRRNTGKILGFVLAANGFGGAVAAQVVTPIIYEEGNPFGYRNAYWMMVGILLLVAVVVVPLMRENPPELVIAPAPKEKKKERNGNWDGIDYAHAVKMAYFIPSVLCVLCTGMILQGLSGISAAHMQDKGIGVDFVAGIVSFQMMILAASKFLAGVSYDKFGLRITILTCHILAVSALILMPMAGATSVGKAAAVAYSVVAFLAMPLETIMLSLIALGLFGNRSFAKMMGIYSAFNTAGYALGTPLGNWCYDLCGSYDPAIRVSAVIMAVVTVVFQFVITAAQKQRRITEGEENETGAQIQI